MLSGQSARFRNGLCSICGVRERRPGQRTCKECHRQEIPRAEFARFSQLVYEELGGSEGLDYTLEAFRSVPVMMAALKVWLAGR